MITGPRVDISIFQNFIGGNGRHGIFVGLAAQALIASDSGIKLLKAEGVVA